MKRKKVETEDQELKLVVQQCGAWCFILGVSASAFCTLAKEHEGEHETKVSVYVEPKSEFKITWTLEK